MNPLVSVVMPVWNGEEFLGAAIDSLLAQTFRDFELIVVDDGSTDRTPAILKSYADARLRVYRLDHAGIVTALNHGLAHARADWIARQDADDLSQPDRLEKQWAALSRQPSAVLSHTAVEYIGEGRAGAGYARLPRSRSFTALRLCSQCPITHSTVLFRKAVALAAGGYRQEERHAEDFALWGRMLLAGEFVALPEKLVQFRIHPMSVSKQNLEVQKALAQKIAIAHCREFMRLSEAEAARASHVLSMAADHRTWADWGWFLTRCLPRLRWQSAETHAWLLQQTVKQMLRKL